MSAPWKTQNPSTLTLSPVLASSAKSAGDGHPLLTAKLELCVQWRPDQTPVGVASLADSENTKLSSFLGASPTPAIWVPLGSSILFTVFAEDSWQPPARKSFL